MWGRVRKKKKRKRKNKSHMFRDTTELANISYLMKEHVQGFGNDKLRYFSQT